MKFPVPRSFRPLKGSFRTFGPFQPPGDLPPRQVTVYVPQGASETTRRPALYMFDGQNVFGDEGTFAGGWHLHQAIDRMSTRTNHVPVVIGIEHGGTRRIEELAPWPVKDRPGLADPFLDWVAETVVPAMQQELPLLRGPVGAAIGGSSMGGLAALYAHYRYPQLFGGCISMSPAFWVGGRRLFEYLAQQPRPSISRVYVDCGAREGMLGVAERVVQQLAKKDYPEGQLKWRPDPRGTHSERHWARRSHAALRFMFRR